MSNKDKYLKYKFKYINLKKQISLQSQKGGVDPEPINILIVSHNSRLRCLFSKLFSGENIPRFKNAAIVKLELVSDIVKGGEVVKVKLIYEGEVNNPKKGYAVMGEPKGFDTKLKEDFPKIKLSINDSTLTNKNYNIYLVRHGEGTHNTKKGEYKEEDDDVDEKTLPPITAEETKKCAEEQTACENKDTCVVPPQLENPKEDIPSVDTNLTPEGILQANRAGEILKGIKFSAVFVSDLFRTIQTLNGLNLPQIKNNTLKPYVLPCSHEIQYYKGDDKPCDGHVRNSRCWFMEIGRKIVAPENISICRHEKARKENPRCKEPLHAIRDWSQYDMTQEKYCKDANSNMIERAIHFTNIITKK
jgi:broad specificity phosphatase PhoE